MELLTHVNTGRRPLDQLSVLYRFFVCSQRLEAVARERRWRDTLVMDILLGQSTLTEASSNNAIETSSTFIQWSRSS